MSSAPLPTDPTVLIVILNWNDADQTLEAVRAALALVYANFRLLVIDNGSEDRSLSARLRKLESGSIEIIESPVNLGYSGGCNLGLKHAMQLPAKYVWLLNNDAVCSPNTLSSLVEMAERDPKVGLVSPLISSDTEGQHLTYAGGVTVLEKRLHDATGNLDEARQWRQEYPNCEFISGAAMLIRTSMVQDIGGFDESFFAYYEDTDLSVRALRGGYRNVVDEEATVYHPDKTVSTDPLSVRPHYWYYMTRNSMRFWRKHLGLRKSLKVWWWTCRSYLRRSSQIRANAAAYQALFAGIWHGLLDRGGPYDPSYKMPLLLERGLAILAKRVG